MRNIMAFRLPLLWFALLAYALTVWAEHISEPEHQLCIAAAIDDDEDSVKLLNECANAFVNITLIRKMPVAGWVSR